MRPLFIDFANYLYNSQLPDQLLQALKRHKEDNFTGGNFF
jgi:hypothetical protein